MEGKCVRHGAAEETLKWRCGSRWNDNIKLALKNIREMCNLAISSKKTKVVALKINFPVRTKIVIDSNIALFICLGFV